MLANFSQKSNCMEQKNPHDTTQATEASSSNAHAISLDTLLLAALKNGNTDLAGQMLEAGANPNAENAKGRPVLEIVGRKYSLKPHQKFIDCL